MRYISIQEPVNAFIGKYCLNKTEYKMLFLQCHILFYPDIYVDVAKKHAQCYQLTTPQWISTDITIIWFNGFLDHPERDTDKDCVRWLTLIYKEFKFSRTK